MPRDLRDRYLRDISLTADGLTLVFADRAYHTSGHEVFAVRVPANPAVTTSYCYGQRLQKSSSTRNLMAPLHTVETTLDVFSHFIKVRISVDQTNALLGSSELLKFQFLAETSLMQKAFSLLAATCYVEDEDIPMQAAQQFLMATPAASSNALLVSDDKDILLESPITGRQIVAFYDGASAVPPVLPFGSYITREAFEEAMRPSVEQANSADYASGVPQRGMKIVGQAVPLSRVRLVSGVAQAIPIAGGAGAIDFNRFAFTESRRNIIFLGRPNRLPEMQLNGASPFVSLEKRSDFIQIQSASAPLQLQTTVAISRTTGTEGYKVLVVIRIQGEIHFTGIFNATREVFTEVQNNF